MTKKTKKSKSSRQALDPFHQRERQNYAEPIPSREFILETLKNLGRPLSKKQLISALKLSKATEQEALGFRLRAMVRDSQLMQDRKERYCLLDRINLKCGTVQAHPDGFGFFISDETSKDLLISAREMRTVMHGDTVLVHQTGLDRRGRPECKIHEVLKHANPRVVGRFFSEKNVSFVTPDNKRLTQDISIPEAHTNNASSGQVVLVEILSYPAKHTKAIGKVIQILGEHMAPGMEIQVAILAHGIPNEWPDEVHASLKNIPDVVHDADIKNRTDLRHLPFVTIDGEDAKDFDDAVFCKPKPKGGYQLYVAIADVSHYVPINSPLDKEAALRGNSVYFPENVVPMLPEVLSNGICSLKPKVDRLCMVMEMAITPEGKIQRSRVYRAVIHSNARLTYTEVSEWLKSGTCTHPKQALIFPALENLYALYHLLQKTRKARGAMDFDTTETRIVFDENRKIQRIIPVIRNDAHRLIEECMLAANVAAANFLEKSGIPTLYRVHPAPTDDKLTTLRQFLGEFGLTLGGGEKPSPKDFQKTLTHVGEKPERHLIETVMLRSLKQAQYIEANDGHFGLAYPAYTHFTSPIRRYPDLLIHRAIGHLLDNQSSTDGFAYDEKEMCRLGKHCSVTERRADEATREVIAWLKCEYMQDKIGQTFQGKIAGVTSFGIFVALDDIYVEGLVHITSLKRDYYAFDAVKHRLVGERTGHTYRLGDLMTVLVARVDLDERKIDFEPMFDSQNPDEQ